MEFKEEEPDLVENRYQINLDFDDVLNNLTVHWQQVHLDATGEDLDFSQWNLHEISEFGKQIYDYFGLPDFFENAEPQEGLQNLFRFLTNNSNLFTYRIVSHCTGKAMDNYESVLLQKSQWLKDYLDETAVEKLILTDEPKSNWPADIVIDDKIDNLLDCKEASVLILMRATHNRLLSIENVKYDYGLDIVIVENLNEVVEVLEDVKEKGLDHFNY